MLNGWVPTTINATPASQYPGPTPGPTPVGSIVVVNWSAPANHAPSDWVGLYRAGEPDARYLARQTVTGGTTGTLSFTLPATAGRYEFRYFVAGGFTRAATSNALTALPPGACNAQGCAGG